jgi:hypothetical protein
MIVDTHVHLGSDEVFDVNFTEAEMWRGIVENGIDISIIQPATAVFYEPVIAQHDAIARFVAAHPGRAYGMANPNPHLPEELYRREVTRCVKELGFVAIKVQSAGHATGINSQAAQKVYRIAQELDVAVMVHTGGVAPFSSPLLAIPVAQQNPGLRLVLAHSGGNASGAEAVIVAQQCPNVTLETTWSNFSFLRYALDTLGAERIVFGSDNVPNIGVELAKFRSLKLSDRVMEMCMSGTAKRVFKLPVA